nr:unnamed protein product [Callosobruchus analis]
MFPFILNWKIPQRNTLVKDNVNQMQCWVPGCPSNTDHFPRKIFYSIPTDPLLRDVWLAAAGKRYHLPLQNILFCEDHFSANEEKNDAFPVCNMPQKICRTCLAPIQNKKYCILSSNINSKMPASIRHIFGPAMSLPLIEVVKFCFPEVTIEMNPIPVSCDSCYHNLWLYYFFKKRYKEKILSEQFYSRIYGSLPGCRTCPSNECTNVVPPNIYHLLESLLKSMLGNVYASTSLPIQLCLECITTLKELLDFTSVFLRTQEYFRQPRRVQEIQSTVEKPIVAVNKEDASQKLLLGRLMLEKGMGLKGQNTSEAQQATIWNDIQKSFAGYGYILSIQALKDTWSRIMLEYSL